MIKIECLQAVFFLCIGTVTLLPLLTFVEKVVDRLELHGYMGEK